MKRILSFTLALIMALTVLPISVFATEVTVTDVSLPTVIDPASTEAPAEVEVHYQTVTHANPLYFSEPVITSVTEYHSSMLQWSIQAWLMKVTISSISTADSTLELAMPYLATLMSRLIMPFPTTLMLHRKQLSTIR